MEIKTFGCEAQEEVRLCGPTVNPAREKKNWRARLRKKSMQSADTELVGTVGCGSTQLDTINATRLQNKSIVSVATQRAQSTVG